ncbi:MAG: O-antigen ligase family protein [Clostridia bacterium]|nr:O-antigen ligase family protein [Clostridia bacterium]
MVFEINASDFTTGGIIWLSCGIALVIIGMIIHLIRFKPSFLFLKPNKIKGYTFAVLLILPVVALGGVTMTNRNGIVFFAIALCSIAISLMYLFFYATTNNGQKDEMLKIIIRTIMVMGALICVQMLTIAFKAGSLEAIKIVIDRRQFALSWAHPNNVAILLALSIPMTLYYATKLKKTPIFPIALAILEFAIMLLTTSRGPILFTAVALPIIAVFVFIKAKNRKQVGISFGICILLAVAFVVVFKDTIQDLFARFLELGLSDNGRFDIYREAVSLFKTAPIFGIGLDYGFGIWGTYQFYWFHSTIFQILASFGIFGVLCFAYFFFARYRAFLIKPSTAKLAVLAGLLLMEAYGMVDIVFFNSYTYIIMMFLCLGAEKSLDEKQGLAFPQIKQKKSN